MCPPYHSNSRLVANSKVALVSFEVKIRSHEFRVPKSHSKYFKRRGNILKTHQRIALKRS
jgi:hypothetical protein